MNITGEVSKMAVQAPRTYCFWEGWHRRKTVDSSTSTAQWGVTKSSAQDEAEPALEGPKGEDGGGGIHTRHVLGGRRGRGDPHCIWETELALRVKDDERYLLLKQKSQMKTFNCPILCLIKNVRFKNVNNYYYNSWVLLLEILRH